MERKSKKLKKRKTICSMHSLILLLCPLFSKKISLSHKTVSMRTVKQLLSQINFHLLLNMRIFQQKRATFRLKRMKINFLINNLGKLCTMLSWEKTTSWKIRCIVLAQLHQLHNLTVPKAQIYSRLRLRNLSDTAVLFLILLVKSRNKKKWTVFKNNKNNFTISSF